MTAKDTLEAAITAQGDVVRKLKSAATKDKPKSAKIEQCRNAIEFHRGNPQQIMRSAIKPLLPSPLAQ
uniref:Uncharacterized protein n=1 Tax=Anopheles arabiensis TaxID=7173 RepID=A0A182I9G2_ANOAR